MEQLTVENVGLLKSVTVGSGNETTVPYYASAQSVTETQKKAAVNGVADAAVEKSTVTLNEGSIYRITFTMAGSSSIPGFGKVEGQGQVHYTHPMKSDNTYTVEFRPTVSGEYVITTCWGANDAEVTLHNYTNWSVTSEDSIDVTREHWHECTYDADGNGVADCDYEVDRAYHFYDKWNYTPNGEESAYSVNHSHDCICGHEFTVHPVFAFVVYSKPLFKSAEPTPLANTQITFVNKGSTDFNNTETTDANGQVVLELGESTNENGGTYVVNLTTPNEQYYNGFTTFTLSKGVPTLAMEGYDEQYWIESAGGNIYNLYIAEVVLADASTTNASWEVVEPEENGDGYYTYSRYSNSVDVPYMLQLDGSVLTNNDRAFLTTPSGYIDVDGATVISFTFNGPISKNSNYYPTFNFYVNGYKRVTTSVNTLRYFQLCNWNGKLSFKDMNANVLIENSSAGIWLDKSNEGAIYHFDMRLVILDNYISLYARQQGETDFVCVADPYQINANASTFSEYSSLTYVGTTEIVDVNFSYVEDTHVEWDFANLQINKLEESTLNIGDIIVYNEQGEKITVNGDVLDTLTVNGDDTSTSFYQNSTVEVNAVTGTAETGYQYVVTEMRLFGTGIPEKGVVIEHVGDANFNSTATISNVYFDDALYGYASSREYTLQVTVTKKYIGANVTLTVYGKDLFRDEKQVIANKSLTIAGNGVTLTATTDANGVLSLSNLKTGEYTVSYDDAELGIYEYKFTLTAEGETSAVKYTLTVDNVVDNDTNVTSSSGAYDARPTLAGGIIVLQHIPYREIYGSYIGGNQIQGDKYVFADSNGVKHTYALGDHNPYVNVDEINYGTVEFYDTCFTAPDAYSDSSLDVRFTEEVYNKARYVEMTLHNPIRNDVEDWWSQYDTIDMGGMVVYLRDTGTNKYLSMGIVLYKNGNDISYKVRVGSTIWHGKDFTQEQLALFNGDGLQMGVGFDDYGVYIYFTDINGDRECVLWRENVYEEKSGNEWIQITFDVFDSISTKIKYDYITGLKLYESLPVIVPDVTSNNGTVTTNADAGTLPVSSDYTITITPNSGYEVDRIYLDGEDVTTEFVNNTATFERYKNVDSKIVVEYRETNVKTPITFEVWGQVSSSTYVKLDNEILFLSKSNTRPEKSVLTEDMEFVLTADVINGKALAYVPKDISGVYYANIEGYRPVQLTFVSGRPSITRLEFRSTIESTTVVDGMNVSYTGSEGMDGGLTMRTSLDDATVTFDSQLFDANNARIEFEFTGVIEKDKNYCLSLAFDTVWDKEAQYQLLIWTNNDMPNGGIALKDYDRNESVIIYKNPAGVEVSKINFKFSMRINEHAYVTKITGVPTVDNVGNVLAQPIKVTDLNDNLLENPDDVTHEGRLVASINGLTVIYENLSNDVKTWQVDAFKLNAQKLVITAGEIADVEIIPMEEVAGNWTENGNDDAILFHSAKVIFELTPNVALVGLENISGVYFNSQSLARPVWNPIGEFTYVDELGVGHTCVFEKTSDNTFELTVFYYDSIDSVFYADFNLQIDLAITVTTRTYDKYMALRTMPTDIVDYGKTHTIWKDTGSGVEEVTEPYSLKPYVELRGRALGNTYRTYFRSNNASDLTTIHFKNVVADTYDVTLFWDDDAEVTDTDPTAPGVYSKGKTEYLDTYMTIDFRPSYDLVFDYITFRYYDGDMLDQTHINDGEGYYTFVQPSKAESLNGKYAYSPPSRHNPTNLLYPSNYYAEMNLLNPALYSAENAKRWENINKMDIDGDGNIDTMDLNKNGVDDDHYETGGIIFFFNIYYTNNAGDKSGKYFGNLSAGTIFNSNFAKDYDEDGVIDNPGWALRWGNNPWTAFELTEAQWELYNSTGGLKMAMAQNDVKDTVFLYADDGTGALALLGSVTIQDIVNYRGLAANGIDASMIEFAGVCEMMSNVNSYGTDVSIPAGTNVIRQDGSPVYISGGYVYSDSALTQRLGMFGVDYASNTRYGIIFADYTSEKLYFPEGTEFIGPLGALVGFKDLLFKTTLADLSDLRIDVSFVDSSGNDVPDGVYAHGEVAVDAMFMARSVVTAYANTGYYLSGLKINGETVTIDYSSDTNSGFYEIPVCTDRKLVIEATFTQGTYATINITDASTYLGFDGTATITAGTTTKTYDIVDGVLKYRVGELPTGSATMTVTSLYQVTDNNMPDERSVSTSFTIDANGNFSTNTFRLANITNVNQYISTSMTYYSDQSMTTTKSGSGWTKSIGSNGGATISYTAAATDKVFLPLFESINNDYVTTLKFRYNTTHPANDYCHYPALGLRVVPNKTPGTVLTENWTRIQMVCWKGQWSLKPLFGDSVQTGTNAFISKQSANYTANIYFTMVANGDTLTFYASSGADMDYESQNWTQTWTGTNTTYDIPVTNYRNANTTAVKVVVQKAVLTGLSIELDKGNSTDYPAQVHAGGSFNDIVVRREYRDEEAQYSYPTALDVFPGYHVDLLPMEGEEFYDAPTVTFSGNGANYLSFIDKGNFGQIYAKPNALPGDYTATIKQRGFTYTTKITVGELAEGLYWDSNPSWDDSKSYNAFYSRLMSQLENIENFNYDPGELVIFMGDSYLDEANFFKGFEARFQNMNAISFGISSSTAAHWYYFGQRIFKYQPKALVLSMGQMAIWDSQDKFYPYYNKTYTFNGNTYNPGDKPADRSQINSQALADTIINTIEHYHRNMPSTTIFWQNILERGYGASGAPAENSAFMDTNQVNTIVKNYFSGKTWFKYSDANKYVSEINGVEVNNSSNPNYITSGAHLSDNEGYDAYIYALIRAGFSYGSAGNVVTPNSKERNLVQMVPGRTTSLEDNYTAANKRVPGAAGSFLLSARMTVHDYKLKGTSSNNVAGHISINLDGTNLRFLLFAPEYGDTYYFGVGYKYPTTSNPNNVLEEYYSKRSMTIPKGMDTVLDMAILSHFDNTTNKYNVYWFVNGELVRVLVNIDNVNGVNFTTEWMSTSIENVQIARPQVMMTNFNSYVRYPEVNVTRYNSYLDRALMWRNGIDLGDKMIGMDPNATGAPARIANTENKWSNWELYGTSNPAPDEFMFEVDAFFSQGNPSQNAHMVVGFNINEHGANNSWWTRFIVGDNNGSGTRDYQLNYIAQWHNHTYRKWESTDTMDVSGATEYRRRFAVLVKNDTINNTAEIYFLETDGVSNFQVKIMVDVENYNVHTVNYGAAYLNVYFTAPIVRFPGEAIYEQVAQVAENAKTAQGW